MIHYPQNYEITAATPRSPINTCDDCGGDLKFSPATLWTDEGYGCLACGKFHLAEPYRQAAKAHL